MKAIITLLLLISSASALADKESGLMLTKTTSGKIKYVDMDNVKKWKLEDLQEEFLESALYDICYYGSHKKVFALLTEMANQSEFVPNKYGSKYRKFKIHDLYLSSKPNPNSLLKLPIGTIIMEYKPAGAIHKSREFFEPCP